MVIAVAGMEEMALGGAGMSVWALRAGRNSLVSSRE